jgi:hypothetical protein
VRARFRLSTVPLPNSGWISWSDSAFKRGFQTRNPEMDLARLPGELADH